MVCGLRSGAALGSGRPVSGRREPRSGTSNSIGSCRGCCSISGVAARQRHEERDAVAGRDAEARERDRNSATRPIGGAQTAASATGTSRRRRRRSGSSVRDCAVATPRPRPAARPASGTGRSARSRAASSSRIGRVPSTRTYRFSRSNPNSTERDAGAPVRDLVHRAGRVAAPRRSRRRPIRSSS